MLSDAGTRLEGVAGKALKNGLVGFQKKVKSGGRLIGEIDSETKNAIVEVTSGRGRKKVSQIRRLIGDSRLNPEGKKVIVFGPNIKQGTASEIEKLGAVVVRSADELARAAL